MTPVSFSRNNHLFRCIKRVRWTAAVLCYRGSVIPLSVERPAGDQASLSAKPESSTGGIGLTGFVAKRLASYCLGCRAGFTLPR
jgi:hypothetical protein